MKSNPSKTKGNSLSRAGHTRYALMAMLCALSLLLGACGGSANPSGDAVSPTPQTIGGYVESLLDVSEYAAMTPPVFAQDGSIYAAAKKTDDGDWLLLHYTDAKSAPTSSPLDIEGSITQLAINPDGELALLITADSGNDGGMPFNFGAPNASAGDATDAADDAANAADATPGVQSPANPPRMQGGESFSIQGGPGGVFLGGGALSVTWVDATGKTLDSQDLMVGNGMVSRIAALSDRQLLVSTMQDGVVRIDASGKEIMRYDGEMASSFCVAGNVLYTVSRADSSLIAYDLETGSQTRSVPMQQDTVSLLTTLMAAAPDGTLYLASNDGVWKLGTQDEAPGKVMEGLHYTIGDPSTNLSGLLAKNDGSLLIVTGNSGSMSIGGGAVVSSIRIGGGGNIVNGGQDGAAQWLSYTWNPTLDLSNIKNLTITALEDSQQLRKAIADFQREHPDVHITLNSFMDANADANAINDYVRAINAELLAGKGGDILVLDGLPMDTYISKGILKDLTDALADIGILPGIREGSKAADGKTYAIPATFSFDTLWASKEKLEGVQSLEDLAAKADTVPDGRTVLAPQTVRQLLESFFPASKSAFTDANGRVRLDTPEFEAFLECLLMVYTEPDASTETNNPFGTRGGGGTRGFAMVDIQSLLNESVEYLKQTIMGTMQVSMGYSAAGESESAWINLPSIDGASKGYTPSLLVGVNAQSQYADLATEFVKLLYSDEVQSMAGFNGLPTVAASLDKLVENQIEIAANTSSQGGMMGFSLSGGGSPMSFSISQPNEDTWRRFRAYCDELNQAQFVDETLMNFMVEETEKFFAGTKSAKDTANALQQRVAAYLGE